MTEELWGTCADPQPMLEHLQGLLTPRKLRLYACAWAREVWHLLGDERSRDAIVAAERFADGGVTASELALDFNAAQEVWQGIRVELWGRHSKRLRSPKGSRATKAAAEVARNAANPLLNLRTVKLSAWRDTAARAFALADILRDLFGPRPFQSVAIEPAFRTPAVLALAETIYHDRQFEDIPVLADAIEDAGCTEGEILQHLRREGHVHVRGCWLLDLLLNKG